MLIKYAILGLALASIPIEVLSKDSIVLWERNYQRPEFRELIELAAELSKEDFGEYEIVPSESIEQGRAFTSLHTGELLNVAIAGINIERETQGIPIYVPVDRGLLGFRVCLLNRDSTQLAHADVVDAFLSGEVLVGVGSHWPDRYILEANGINVAHSPVYESLFAMLDKKRFECLLRSINEVSGELELFAKYNLNIEPNWAFVYPYGDFIFVSTAKRRIHHRLQLGIQKALVSGEFMQHFQKHYKSALKNYRFIGRKLVYLSNSDLSLNALDAINQWGVASFSPPAPVDSK